jgi:phosphoadenosine phosphosulfate reductase
MNYREKPGLDRLAGAEDVLRWALESFHPRVAIASSLQESILIHMGARIRPDLRVFTIDTGRLPEEAYVCAEEIRRQMGVRIEWYFPRHEAVEQLETQEGPFSFKNSLEARQKCCFIRKVEPLNRALAGLDAWITGLRRDESVTRSALAKVEKDAAHGGIVKVNPLADWTAEDVSAYIRKHRIPYNRLLDRGYASIGCACCTRPIAPGEEPRAGRWWWERPEHKECGLHARDWSI